MREFTTTIIIVMELLHGQTEKNTSVNGGTEKGTAKVLKSGLMGVSTSVNGKIIKGKAMVPNTDISKRMWVNGKMTISKDRVL
jgi:hypothetical protein